VITALFSPDGTLTGFTKVTRDLTERKLAEEQRIRALEQEREARSRAEHALERLRAIQSVTEAALAHLELDSLLHELLNRVSEVLFVDTVAVLLLTDDKKYLVPRAAKGIEEEVELGIHLPVGRGFAGRIAAERQPVILEDVEHSNVLNPVLREKGIKSLLGVPLVIEGEVLGVLHVGTLYPRRFTESDVSFLQIVGDRVALAIDHARLYETTERALRQAESAGQELRLRDEFLSVAAHELKTPITGLRTAAQVLVRQFDREGAAMPPRMAQMAEVLDHESGKLANLVNQLLDLSRLEGGKLALKRETVDLLVLARGVTRRAQAHAPDHQLILQGLSSLEASVDPLRIEQVLVNLVDNAVKYSPQGGEISIEVSQPDDQTVQVAVRDHGIGLSVAHRERIFERFYQVDAGERSTGLGLGLYISREIAERHGGSLWAENPLDGGTRFIMSLPVGAPSRTPNDET